MMAIHQPNRKRWKRGDIVIHDRDAKEQRMLRIVVAELPDGRLRTVFAFRNELPSEWRRRVFLDDPRLLHDPRRFGISIGKGKAA